MNIKKQFEYGYRVRLLVLAALPILVAACAPIVQVTPEALVSQRVETRWKEMIGGNFEAGYGYLSPSYRAVRDFKTYRSELDLSAMTWKGAKVVKVTCEAVACSAQVRIDYTTRMVPGDFNTHIDEKWIFEEGGWWLYRKP